MRTNFLSNLLKKLSDTQGCFHRRSQIPAYFQELLNELFSLFPLHASAHTEVSGKVFFYLV